MLSVVLPVNEDAPPVSGCLEKLLRQTYETKEVVVVCDARMREPVAPPNGAKTVKVITVSEPRGIAGLLNAGLRQASGDIKIVLMPQCVPAGPHWMDQMAAPFADEHVGVVVAQCRMEEKRSMGVSARLMNAVSPIERLSSKKAPEPQELVSHLCDAYRATVLADIGYFDEKSFATPGEAVDASVKVAAAGHAIVLTPQATVFYRVGPKDRTLGRALSRSVDYGFSDAVLGKRHRLEWVNARVFAAALISFVLIPLGFVHLPLAFVLAGLLLIWGWVLPLKLPVVHWDLPVFAFNLALYVGMILLVRGDWAPETFGRNMHPAIIRQWCVLGAVTGSYLLILLGVGVQSALRSVIRDRSTFSAGLVFFLSMLWWLMTGLGYVRGIVAAYARRT